MQILYPQDSTGLERLCLGWVPRDRFNRECGQNFVRKQRGPFDEDEGSAITAYADAGVQ